MKLFIKRDTSASDREFVICDASGNEKYTVVSVTSNVTANANLQIRDANGNVGARIRRLPIPGTMTFVLKAYGTHINFVIVPTQKGVYSYFYRNNWHVSGDIAAKNFTVIDVDKTVVFRHDRHTGYGELTIEDEENELFCIAAAVCVDLLNTVEKHALKTANI